MGPVSKSIESSFDSSGWLRLGRMRESADKAPGFNRTGGGTARRIYCHELQDPYSFFSSRIAARSDCACENVW